MTLIRVNEAAEKLGVTNARVKQLIERGVRKADTGKVVKLSASREGNGRGHYVISARDLVNFSQIKRAGRGRPKTK